MSKTSLLLILLFLMVSGIYFYFNADHKNTEIVVHTNRIPTQTLPIDSTLSLLQSKSTESEIQIQANLDTHNQTPQLVQLEIGYDPNVLTLDSIVAGTYFSQPILILKNINEHIGRISYAIRCNTNEKRCINPQTNTLATFIFSVNNLTKVKQTPIQLLPKTVLKASDEQVINLKLIGASIALNTMISKPATRSALKKY